MNLRQLRSLATILKKGSFTSAGNQMGLSDAAISIQMKQLESYLDTTLFDRSSRPAEFTSEGLRIAQISDEILQKIEDINLVAVGEQVTGTVSIGFIPTCVQYILPKVLCTLRQKFPELQVKVKSGLSDELSKAVIARELDYALLSSPLIETSELNMMPVANEPFFVIGPADQAMYQTDSDLITSMPFIAFSKHTRVAQHVALRLQKRGIYVDEVIEIDSLEAIENLVANGFGVSIVPRRLLADFDSDNLVQIPFGEPVDTRELVLVRHILNSRSQLDKAVREVFSGLPEME